MNTSKFLVSMPEERTIEQVLAAGNYGEVNFVIRSGVHKKFLSMKGEPLGNRKIVLLEPDDRIATCQLLEEARNQKLRRPTYADAFLFGELYPDEQNKGPIVFLHDPAYLWSGHSFYLVLNVKNGRRAISLISVGDWWEYGHRFAFVGE